MSFRRSAVVTVGAIGAFTALVFFSDEPDYDYAAVCVDKATQTRVDDDQCDDDHTASGSGSGGARGWYYVARGDRVPAVGQLAAGGTSTPPFDGRSVGTGFDTAGGVVTRGGFGHGFGSFGG
jgi:hypothetical protein